MMQAHEKHAAAVKAQLDALPPPIDVRAICKGCPHPAECKGKPCLNDIARPALEGRAFSRLMLPAQARAFDEALRDGKSLRMITGSLKKYGPAIATPSKFEAHCAAYPVWGAEKKAMAAANALANNKLKGVPHKNTTHCKKGHELPTEPNWTHPPSAGALAGKRYIRCMVCSQESQRRSRVPNEEIIGRVMVQLMLRRTISSFTAGGSPGFITSHKNFIAMCREYPEIDGLRLAVIESRRAKPKVKKARAPRKTRPIAVRSNVSAKLTGIVAARPDPTHTAIDAVVPRNLPPEMRGDIINDMWLAVKEGELSIVDLPDRLKTFTGAYNKMFPQKYAMASLDAPAFRDGAMPLIETIAQGLWQ